MTWAEFKAAMEAAGVKDSTEIDYLDFSGCLKEAKDLDIDLDPVTNSVNVT